jgi:hypothetical protein
VSILKITEAIAAVIAAVILRPLSVAIAVALAIIPDTIADRMPPMSVYTSGIAVDTIAAIHQSTVLYSSLQTQKRKEC